MASLAFPANILAFLSDKADVPIVPSEPRDRWQNNVAPAAASTGREAFGIPTAGAVVSMERMLLSPDNSFPLLGMSGVRQGRRLDWNAFPSLKKKKEKKADYFLQSTFFAEW